MLGVGDEVICIGDNRPVGWTSSTYPQWVVKGKKYIIREILDNDDIVVGVLLVELRNPKTFITLIGKVQEPAFATWRFEKTRSAYEIAEEKECEPSEVERVQEYLSTFEQAKPS
jgi:hypothetical protein